MRIFFSKREWSKLRETLIWGSRYFLEVVRDAVVMMKLGSAPGDREGQLASLSFLPLVRTKFWIGNDNAASDNVKH
jgi:hypothetical protein